MFGLKNACKDASDITICLKKMSVLRSTHLDRWQSTLAWLRATDGSRLTLPREELSQKNSPESAVNRPASAERANVRMLKNSELSFFNTCFPKIDGVLGGGVFVHMEGGITRFRGFIKVGLFIKHLQLLRSSSKYICQ